MIATKTKTTKAKTKLTKCTLTQRTGRDCELTHCQCGTHDYENDFHTCPPHSEEYDSEADLIARAERDAGWDPSP